MMAALIQYSPAAVDHLSALSKSEQVIVLDQVDCLLKDEPTLASRKRKFLRPNAIAAWELRLGDLRVFYDVTVESDTLQSTVVIKAVGKKIHNELWIGTERITL